VSDSTTSISCGLAVRQVVQLVVRLAACRTTCCRLAVGFRSVVDLSYNMLYDKYTTNSVVTNTTCLAFKYFAQ